MALEFTTLNWVAVIAAAVAGGVIGGIWYLPMVFGNRWAAASGRELPSLSRLTPTMMVGAIGLPLIMAYVLTLLVGGLGGTSLVNGVVVGFVAWLGFTATATLNGVVYEGRSWEWWMITAGFFLVTLVVMGGIIGYLGA
ncbi:MAG: DUF1761 domain-containing protein [Chloroflexota bacterium]